MNTTRRGFLAGVVSFALASRLPKPKAAPSPFRQLAPMRKLPPGTTVRWSQLVYGTAIIYRPRKPLIIMDVSSDYESYEVS